MTGAAGRAARSRRSVIMTACAPITRRRPGSPGRRRAVGERRGLARPLGAHAPDDVERPPVSRPRTRRARHRRTPDPDNEQRPASETVDFSRGFSHLGTHLGWAEREISWCVLDAQLTVAAERLLQRGRRGRRVQADVAVHVVRADRDEGVVLLSCRNRSPTDHAPAAAAATAQPSPCPQSVSTSSPPPRTSGARGLPAEQIFRAEPTAVDPVPPRPRTPPSANHEPQRLSRRHGNAAATPSGPTAPRHQ